MNMGVVLTKMPSLSIYLPNDLFELVKESPSRTIQKALRLLQEKEKQSEAEKNEKIKNQS